MPIPRILTFAALLLCAPGCGISPKHASHHGVHQTADSKTITTWGLQQTDAGMILDAYLALVNKFHEDVASEEHQAALDGAVAIYQKVDGGWPGFSGKNYYMKPESTVDLEFVVLNCYRLITGWRGNWFPWPPRAPSGEVLPALPREKLDRRSTTLRELCKTLMLRIKPANGQSERLNVWNDIYHQCGFDLWQAPCQSRTRPEANPVNDATPCKYKGLLWL